jgi:peptidoglycan hydrolase-like protein with peptidoglycan-binding domain
MKSLLSIGLFLICTASVANAQAGSKLTGTLTSTQIKDAEQRLTNLGYWTGPIDGIFDQGARSALIAFQKWEGRPVTGQLTMDELEAIRTSNSPRARESGYEHAEVDLDRQVFLWVMDGGRVRVLPVSTGTSKPYVDDGEESIAYTPRGRFLVYRKGVGWEKGALGSVYYPNDISGGIAIHGSRNVPAEPASHGCIRIPMFAAREVSKLLKLGTIVLGYDKVSFVSAKDWVKNPKLKEAALANIAADDDYVAETLATKTKSLVIKKPRSKTIRA